MTTPGLKQAPEDVASMEAARVVLAEQHAAEGPGRFGQLEVE